LRGRARNSSQVSENGRSTIPETEKAHVDVSTLGTSP